MGGAKRRSREATRGGSPKGYRLFYWARLVYGLPAAPIGAAAALDPGVGGLRLAAAIDSGIADPGLLRRAHEARAGSRVVPGHLAGSVDAEDQLLAEGQRPA